MIMIQIDLPVVNEKIDFLVDEYAEVCVLKAEILQIIQRKYDDALKDMDVTKFDLYLTDREAPLGDSQMLCMYGVTDGTEFLYI